MQVHAGSSSSQLERGTERAVTATLTCSKRNDEGTTATDSSSVPALRATVRWTANGNIHAHGERRLSGNFHKTEIAVFWWVFPWSCRLFVPMCIFYWHCSAFLLKFEQCHGGYLIILTNLNWEQTQDFLSSGIPLIRCLLCQMLNKLENLMYWHALWAHPRFSVFKTMILQFTHCSGSVKLCQFWAVKLWSPKQQGCQSQSEGFL